MYRLSASGNHNVSRFLSPEEWKRAGTGVVQLSVYFNRALPLSRTIIVTIAVINVVQHGMTSYYHR